MSAFHNGDKWLVKDGYAEVRGGGVHSKQAFGDCQLQGGTYFDQAPHYEGHAAKLPLHIQDHGNPIRFRNIWVRENIQPIKGEKPTPSQAEVAPLQNDAAVSPTEATPAPSADVAGTSPVSQVEFADGVSSYGCCPQTCCPQVCCPETARMRWFRFRARACR
jgi:hypothetical protein